MQGPSLTGATWKLVEPPADGVARARDQADLNEVAARCLAIREGSPSWLAPSLGDLHDPYEMRGMEAALRRLRKAVRDRERIRVITDYDVDGTTSSLILQAALTAAGGQRLDWHIPDRFGEGYGFSVEAADAAARDRIDLIVTADIGVRDHEAVRRAISQGVDVLVCDHHLPEGEAVPDEALVLCPPQAACDYPNPHLAACGISLKVAQALLAEHPKGDAIVQSLLKLAAIGTVADLVPLTTLENRAIVALGLRGLNAGLHTAGLDALLAVSKLEPGTITEAGLGWQVGPRINAAGRLSNAGLVIELLTCRDPARARALATELNRLNDQRKGIQQEMLRLALERVPSPPPAFPCVAGPEAEGWHRGVVGIVAGRLREQLDRPVAVGALQGDHVVGSVRSMPGIHAVEALASASDLLVRFGGHAGAAGFTVATKHLEALGQRLCAYAEPRLGTIQRIREVDATITPSELDEPLHRQLRRLGPFGMGNPEPRLQASGVRLRGVEVRGGGKLLRFRLPRPQAPDLVGIWWRRADLAPILAEQSVDLLGRLTENHFRGRRTLQFEVDDARISD